jgi:hypothetical protein
MSAFHNLNVAAYNIVLPYDRTNCVFKVPDRKSRSSSQRRQVFPSLADKGESLNPLKITSFSSEHENKVSN